MFQRRTWIIALTLAQTLLLATPPAQAAEGAQAQWLAFLAEMRSQGWDQIASGVFERKAGPSKAEVVAYGREGLAWMIGYQNLRLAALNREFRRFPSDELARAIQDLTLMIAKAQSDLAGVPATLTSQVASLVGGSCSSICYSATADAYPLTAAQGVAAVADATFNSACGFLGDTFAYARARATAGTTTTEIIQQDPKTAGASIASHAFASVNGGSVTGIPCVSDANSWVQSSTLGIAYSTSDANTLCPVPPNPIPTIFGTTYEYFTTLACVSRTFTSSVTSGTPPYTNYQWKVGTTVVSTGTSYTRSVCPAGDNFTLTLTVTDSAGRSGTDTHFVEVVYEPSGGCLALPCQ